MGGRALNKKRNNNATKLFTSQVTNTTRGSEKKTKNNKTKINNGGQKTEPNKNTRLKWAPPLNKKKRRRPFGTTASSDADGTRAIYAIDDKSGCPDEATSRSQATGRRPQLHPVAGQHVPHLDRRRVARSVRGWGNCGGTLEASQVKSSSIMLGLAQNRELPPKKNGNGVLLEGNPTKNGPRKTHALICLILIRKHPPLEGVERDRKPLEGLGQTGEL